MPRLSDLLKNQATLVVPYRGTEITITYKPEALTAEQQAAIQKRVADGQLNHDDMDAAMVCDLVTSWNLTGDDDQPCPLTFEFVRARSKSLLMHLVQAMYDDQRNPQQGR